jgi:hypothetical protein
VLRDAPDEGASDAGSSMGSRSANVCADDVRDRSPELVRLFNDLFRMLASRYFRIRIEGIEHVPPRGPALLVANHNGGLVPIDSFFTAMAVHDHFGVERVERSGRTVDRPTGLEILGWPTVWLAVCAGTFTALILIGLPSRSLAAFVVVNAVPRLVAGAFLSRRVLRRFEYHHMVTLKDMVRLKFQGLLFWPLIYLGLHSRSGLKRCSDNAWLLFSLLCNDVVRTRIEPAC